MPNQSAKRKTLFSLQNYGSSTGYAVSASNVGITGANPCSMIQWVMPQRLIAAFQVAMAIGTPAGAAGTSYLLGIDASDKYIARLGGSISAQGPVARVGVPVPLILTSNGSRLRLYIGQSFITEAAITPNITNGPLMIGSDLTSGSPSPFFGLVSDPILCNAELTQAEITEYATAGIVPASAILHYQMGLDGGAGTSVTDAIGTNHATITGMSWNIWSPYQERRRIRPAKSALRLDGSTGYIPFGSHASYAIGNAGWLKVEFLLDKNQVDTNTANNRFLMTLGDGSLTNFITLIVRNSAPFELVADCRAGGVSKGLASVGANTLGLMDGNRYEALLTWDGTSADLYFRGKRVATRVEDMRVSGLATGTPDLVAGRLNSSINARYLTGELGRMAYGNAKLTAQEVYDNHYFGKPIASQVGAWDADDMGGPTVNITGTGNPATIGGTTTWVKRVGVRKTPNNNLIANGDFEAVPAFVAATSTAGRWIDGTAGGSTTNLVPAWAVEGINSAGTFAVRFDPAVFYAGSASLKISTTAAASAASASPVRSVGTASLVLSGGIPCQPNKSYRMTYRMKTQLNSGDATTGAYAFLRTYDTAGSAVATVDGTKVKTTTDWTLYTVDIVTGASAAYLVPMLRVVGNDGAATLVMDAWFDEVVLKPSVPTRQLAVNGSLAFNGNFEDVPPVLTAGTNTAGRWIDGTAAGSATRRDWGWAIPVAGVTASAEATYDPAVSHSGQASLKLSTLNAAGVIVAANALSGSAPIPSTDRIFPLLPSTQYRLTGWIKTNNVASNGAYIDIRESNASLVTVTTTSSTKLSGTNDWTQVTINFTTSSTTYWGMILLRNFVAGNVSDAWFDDIIIKPISLPAGRRRVQNILHAGLFDGGSSKISVDNAATLSYGTGDFTSAALVMPTGFASNPAFNVIYSGYSANVSGQRGFIYAFDASLKLSAYIDSGSPNIATSTRGLKFNDWNLVVLRRTGDTLEIFLDGCVVGTATGVAAALATSSVPGTLGQHPAAATTFTLKGLASQFVNWGRALTNDEIMMLYAFGPAFISRTNLTLEWLFTNGGGATVTDTSGNNHNGTLSVAAWSTLSPGKPRQI